MTFDASGLHQYQVPHAEKLVASLLKHGVAADGSDTGTGKTFSACALVRHFNMPTLVVCPKSIRSKWQDVAREMKTDLDTINYEMVRTCRTPYGHRRYQRNDLEWDSAVKFLIFDEVHRCKGRNTQNSDLVVAARRQSIPTLVLSATLAESPLDMKALGYLLGLHDNRTFWRWTRSYGCVPGYFGGFEFTGKGWPSKFAVMQALHKQIFEQRGSRMRVADIPDFPETQITAELCDVAEPGKVNALYADMADALADLQTTKRNDKDPDHPLTRLLRARQQVELLKVPGLVGAAQDGLAAGNAVCLFVQFSQTVDELSVRLDTDCVFDGRLSEKVRSENHRRWRAGDSRVIILQEQAGGEAIDLHDSPCPPLSLISPGPSARRLRQIFGRVHRDGGKFKSIQQVWFAANTVEIANHRRLKAKLNCLDALNDADLDANNL